MHVSLLNYGAVTQFWTYQDIPLILGYDDPFTYTTETNYYLGAIVGRVANRISGAQFTLDNIKHHLDANVGTNTLHGGVDGLSQQYWKLDQIANNKAEFTYLSLDGEGGFPGKIFCKLHVILNYPSLTYIITAQPNRPTPINLAQHNYYTLGSNDGISQHYLKLPSKSYLKLNDQLIPSGEINEAESKFDFTSSKSINEVSHILDRFYLIGDTANPNTLVAELTAPSGISLKVYSDQHGAQVYSGGKLSTPFFSEAGFCIEPSGYPNALNIPTFPSIICTPDNPYQQTLRLEINENL